MKNREILFRGKREDGKGWVFGDLIQLNKDVFIYPLEPYYNTPELDFLDECERVIPETVGQFTGLLDKEGNRIFEGDITKAKGVVFYDKTIASFVIIYPKNPEIGYNKLSNDWIEIIGNIHDNTELI